MPFKIAVATAPIAAVTPSLCRAESAADAAALVTWGAFPSKYYELLRRSPSMIEYHQVSEGNPANLTVVEVSKCKFSISYQNTKYGDSYSGTLDYTAPQWSHLVTTRMKMVNGSLGFQIIHVPGARYCHTSGFSPLDYQVTPGACRDFAAFVPESSTTNGINALKRFCPGGNVVTPAAISTSAPKAKAVSGQWVFAPESETSGKLAWQYTPGQSEFLAIAISCDPSKKSASIVLDLSLETQAKAGQRIIAKIIKGNDTLAIAGKVANGESGPFVVATATYAQVAQLLDQPGDLIVALPHHHSSFGSQSLPGPYATFAKTCQLGGTR